MENEWHELQFCEFPKKVLLIRLFLEGTEGIERSGREGSRDRVVMCDVDEDVGVLEEAAEEVLLSTDLVHIHFLCAVCQQLEPRGGELVLQELHFGHVVFNTRGIFYQNDRIVKVI